MDTKFPLISVLIATYNRAPYLERAVKSVLRQSYPNMEIVIVDDCSSDHTKGVVEELQKESQNIRIKYFRNESNRKFGYTINKAAQHAEGEFYAILGDDDEWCDECKLKDQLEMYYSNNGKRIGSVCTGFRYVTAKQDRIIREVLPVPVKLIEESILTGNYFISSTTVLIPRTVWKDLNGMDESIPKGVDSDFFRRMIVWHNYEILMIPKVMANVYIDSNNRMTSNNTIIGTQKAIQSLEFTLNRFNTEFRKFPKALSKRYLQLSRFAYTAYILSDDHSYKLKTEEFIRQSMKSYFYPKALAFSLAVKIPGFKKIYQKRYM